MNWHPAWVVAFIHGVNGQHRHWKNHTCLWGGSCPTVLRGHWQAAGFFFVLIMALVFGPLLYGYNP